MEKLSSKKIKRAVLLFIMPIVGYLLTRVLYLTCKKRFHTPSKTLTGPLIVAFWHEHILFNPFLYLHIMHKANMALMISDHFDGSMIARMASYFGFSFIRGSSTRGGVRALKESFKFIDQGWSIAITPDGPRGPRHSIADGIVAISQKKDIDIISFRYNTSSAWVLDSWDKFIIPKPFSTIDFYASEPFSIKGLSLEEAKKRIKDSLS
jgi:lysophospholipid acyltransferase (LPLAT)-like uncharacterized protein